MLVSLGADEFTLFSEIRIRLKKQESVKKMSVKWFEREREAEEEG